MTGSALPPLEIVGPHGKRLTLRNLDRADTVDTLARQLGVAALWTRRRKLRPDERLAEVEGLQIGARLWATQRDGHRPSFERRRTAEGGRDVDGLMPEVVVEVVVITGPSCAPAIGLPPGRHVIGRSLHASIHLDDRSVEAHHALLHVESDGAVQLTQLTGSVPVRVDGQALHEHAAALLGARVTVGSTTLTIRPHQQPVRSSAGGGGIGEHSTDPWRQLVWRSPPPSLDWEADPIAAPERPDEPQRPSATGLIGVGATAAGAVAIALVMGNPMFMMFAAIGLFATLATHVVGVVVARRARRRARTKHAQQLAAFVQSVDAMHELRSNHHRSAYPSLAETVDVALGSGSRIWQRRSSNGLTATVGPGTCRWQPAIDTSSVKAVDPTTLQRVEQCARLIGQSAPITLEAGDTVAARGSLDQVRALARSVIIQAATWVGPADWQLVIVSRDTAAWEWADWLPHAALVGCAVVLGDTAADARELGEHLDAISCERLTLVVTDEPLLLTARTGPLRRFIAASNAMSMVLVDRDVVVPALCRRVVTLGATGSATWSGEMRESDDAFGIALTGLSIELADVVARRLACLVDPEDASGSIGAVPTTVSFAQLIPQTAATPIAIAERWRAGGLDPAPIAPLGVSADGRIDIDLVRDGPHALIAGTTGSGKSELLRTLVVSMAASVGPQHVSFVLVDYKGGSTFDACTALPHTVGVVTDLDDGLAERALVSLDAELHRRERLLRAVGASDLTDYRNRPDAAAWEPIARLVVVIDEFAALAKELPDFLTALVGIAQRGRSLGVHLLLATQRPAGVVNDDIRANTNLRLALRLHDRPDAIDVVGDELPATFPRGTPGRAAMRLGPDELVVFQAGRCTGPVPDVLTDLRVDVGADIAAASPPSEAGPSELEVTVAAIAAASEAEGIVAPHRPWVEALPFPLPAAACEPFADDAVHPIGVVDDPAHQCRRALAWKPADGGVALIGAIGSGTTSTMIAMAASVCGQSTPDSLHLYVVDARGDDGLASLATLAHCAGVVRLNEDERLHRLLQRVVAGIDDRMSNTSSGCSKQVEVVLLIDGYSTLRNALGAVERGATFDLLLRIASDGPAAGVALVVADDAGTAVSTVSVAHRWIFHLDDPSAARGMGLRSAPVASGFPGRFRIIGSGLEAQAMQGAPGLAELPTHDDACGGPAPIAALPDRVASTDLEPLTSCVRSDAVALAVGLSGVDLSPTTLTVPTGDHVLIIGGPRTGVSTAVEQCAQEWACAFTSRGLDVAVLRVGRRTPLDGGLLDDESRPIAVVVDDGHRVDDNGELARIAQGEHPHVTLIVGARSDGVRSGYGHWTREVAKSRCGIVMATRGDPDGDLLGAHVPRRPLIPARSGLGWIVDSGPLRQVQIVATGPAPVGRI